MRTSSLIKAQLPGVFFIGMMLSVASATGKNVAPKLTAPKAWVASERFLSGGGGPDEAACVSGWSYDIPSKASATGGLLLTLSATPVPQAGRKENSALPELTQFPRLGSLEDFPRTPLALFCDGAGFSLIQVMGTVDLPPFTRAGWFVADHGQDICGETSIVVYAGQGEANFAMLLPLMDFIPRGTCDEATPRSEKTCARRIRCLQSHLSSVRHRSSIESALKTLTSKLSFAKR